MTAYVIGRLDIRDGKWLKEYGPKTEALIDKHGGRYLVRGGNPARLEGEGKAPNATVVLEFPTIEQARAWYDDPEYGPLVALRQTGSSAELLLVEGL